MLGSVYDLGPKVACDCPLCGLSGGKLHEARLPDLTLYFLLFYTQAFRKTCTQMKFPQA